jgi:hypothetical protein
VLDVSGCDGLVLGIGLGERVAVNLLEPGEQLQPALERKRRLPSEPEMGELVTRAIAAKGRAAAAQAESSNLLRRAARAMTEGGLTVRDAGAVLGMSHQRIAQLIAAPEVDVMAAAVEAAVSDVNSYATIYESGERPRRSKWSAIKAAKGFVDDPAARQAFADEVEAVQAEEGRS